jgi:hypothetical protein
MTSTHLLLLGFFGLLVLPAQALDSAPITQTGCKNLTIRGKTFKTGSAGVAVRLTDCQDVVIEDNVFELDSGIIAIQIQGGRNIVVRGNRFHKVRSGVYAINTTGGIQIECNTFRNIAGSKPRGQMVQFNKGTGAGNRIQDNSLVHDPGSGNPEDLINLYGSQGTADSPIQVLRNRLRGGGPSPSGGGIMAGDNGGGHVVIAENILVDPGQYGIGVPAGHHIEVRDNVVFAKQQSFTNVGIYVGLKGEIDAGFACDGPSISLKGNRVNWTNRNGIQNAFYTYTAGCPGIVNTGNVAKAPITADILPSVPTLDPARCPEATTSASRPMRSTPLVTRTGRTLRWSSEGRSREVATLRAADGALLSVAANGGGFETLEIPAGFRGVAFVNWQETENPWSLRIAVP